MLITINIFFYLPLYTNIVFTMKIRGGGVPEHFNYPWHNAIQKGKFQEQGIEIVYPDGSDYSKRVFGPKRKQKVSVVNSHLQIHPSHLLK